VTVHPIRSAEVQEAVEEWTQWQLARTRGTGKVTVEFDFKDGKPISFRPGFSGPRKPLRHGEQGERS
jgi:hypothetical protein